jgi:hypothetical protein
VDSSGYVGNATSITTGVDGLGLISYSDITNTDLKVAHCSNASCTAATITTLDSAGNLPGVCTSITIGFDGLGVISYYDVTNADLKVAHCSNILCTAASLATVDNAGDVGSASTITIGTDGLPLVSYYDTTNGDLKVAHCSNAFCLPYWRQR